MTVLKWWVLLTVLAIVWNGLLYGPIFDALIFLSKSIGMTLTSVIFFAVIMLPCAWLVSKAVKRG